LSTTGLPKVVDGGQHSRRAPGVTDCTERHTAERAYGLDGEGHEGTPKEAQP
jgi:hypothetical protein